MGWKESIQYNIQRIIHLYIHYTPTFYIEGDPILMADIKRQRILCGLTTSDSVGKKKFGLLLENSTAEKLKKLNPLMYRFFFFNKKVVSKVISCQNSETEVRFLF